MLQTELFIYIYIIFFLKHGDLILKAHDTRIARMAIHFRNQLYCEQVTTNWCCQNPLNFLSGCQKWCPRRICHTWRKFVNPTWVLCFVPMVTRLRQCDSKYVDVPKNPCSDPCGWKGRLTKKLKKGASKHRGYPWMASFFWRWWSNMGFWTTRSWDEPVVKFRSSLHRMLGPTFSVWIKTWEKTGLADVIQTKLWISTCPDYLQLRSNTHDIAS